VTVDLDTARDPQLGQVARLRIENDGVRPNQDQPMIDGHGTGLTGLRERVTRAGGNLAAGGLPHGRYRLEVRLPLAPAATTAEEPTP
jgi:two-component system sensor histidine kinase DesK